MESGLAVIRGALSNLPVNRKPNAGKSEQPGEDQSLANRGLSTVPAGFWEKMGVWRMRGHMGVAEYGRFLAERPIALGFCFLWVLSSSFGQTFFLSLFQPYWVESHGLSTGGIGAIYGGATLVSGLLLHRIGVWIDRASVLSVAGAAGIGLALGAILSAFSIHWSMLLLAIFLLRFCGQGISSMLGGISAARWFPNAQSKATSVVNLGYPTGEAIFPWLLLTLITFTGWRTSALIIAGIVLLIILPLSRLAALRANVPLAQPPEAIRSRQSGHRSIFLDPRFLLIMLVITAQPFIGTGVIFFQAIISEEHGWSPFTFATGFLIFALVRAVCSIFAGAWADAVGPARLFGAPQFILGASMVLLAFPYEWGAYLFFFLMGLSYGIASAIMTPVFSLVFGLNRIGEVRGGSASLGVFSTAVAPALFGFAIQFGMSASTVMLISAGWLLVIAWPASIYVRRKYL